MASALVVTVYTHRTRYAGPRVSAQDVAAAIRAALDHDFPDVMAIRLDPAFDPRLVDQEPPDSPAIRDRKPVDR